MKKGTLLSLAASVVLLASCGPNLGEKITKAEFENHVREFKKIERSQIKSITSEGEMVTKVDGEKTKRNLDATISPDVTPKQGGTNEEVVAYLVQNLDVDYANQWYVKYPNAKIDIGYYWNEGNKCTAMTVSLDFETNVSGLRTTTTLDAKYQWNEYGLLTYGLENQKSEINYSGMSSSMTIDLEISISYSINA